MNREAIKEAIEVLEDASAEMLGETGNENYYGEAIAVLRQALETEQEPVAWASSLDFDDDDQEIIPAKDKGKLGTSNCDIPLYTALLKHDYVIDCPRCGHCCAEREWVGLTDEERRQILLDDPIDWIAAIEAKLKEKNT